MDVLRKLQEVLEAGEVSVLSTIVKAEGSTPRSLGTKMLILANGETVGTIGGGQLELMALKDARDILTTRKSSLKHYDLLPNGTAGHCAGSIDVFHEIFVPAIQVIIFGAGHVGQPLAGLIADLGYSVTVLDPREELISEENFSGRNIERICAGYLQGLSLCRLTRQTVCFVVSPEQEKEILLQVLRQPIRYVGILGSRKKISTLRQQVLAAGISQDDWLKARAPVGLDLGGETPYEVALSIAAELVKELHSGSSLSLNLALVEDSRPIHT